MTTNTPTHDPWATLPTDWRNPRHRAAPPPANPYGRPLPDLSKLPPATCRPRCIRCRHPEGRGLCRTCAHVCDHTIGRGRADICLIRVRVPAVMQTSRATGRQLVLVRTCPRCGRPHFHSAHPDLHPYRLGGCGQPYLLEIT